MVYRSEPGQMLRLTTLGGLTLMQGDRPLTGPPTQRRRLALLAILAVAGETGVSREKLLAMLWPEGDPAKSRHALNQILSAQRRHFGDENLFDGRKTVRLNGAVIKTDIADLEKAIASGDLDAAIELYAGPFLDGFFISGSPEFEMWTSDVRVRLANRLLVALEKAATKAESAGDIDGAIRWKRHAVELDRTDVQRALHLADLLMRAENRAAALRVLKECQKRIEAELGIASEPALARRIASLSA